MSAVSNNQVLLYSGPAADPKCVQATAAALQEHLRAPVKLADKSVFRDLLTLTRARAIVVPGAASAGLLAHEIGDRGLGNIYAATRYFGRPYLGFCAGAIIASGQLSIGGVPYYGNKFPRFFPGTADVSATAEEVATKARTVTLLNGQSGSCHYESGPSFVRAHQHPGVKVLATDENGSAAIIQAGDALLSGLHPELTKTPFGRATMRMIIAAARLRC